MGCRVRCCGTGRASLNGPKEKEPACVVRIRPAGGQQVQTTYRQQSEVVTKKLELCANAGHASNPSSALRWPAGFKPWSTADVQDMPQSMVRAVSSKYRTKSGCGDLAPHSQIAEATIPCFRCGRICRGGAERAVESRPSICRSHGSSPVWHRGALCCTAQIPCTHVASSGKTRGRHPSARSATSPVRPKTCTRSAVLPAYRPKTPTRRCLMQTTLWQ